ncbi:hypothetical protein [Bacillus paramycoides]|uniref:hypothetical protein n=1 Tax=Bacillus paramycoides TaxID=2026194 RepID=UPI00027A1831|nr:hypothetical protein [Bacillus paramycoides]EJR46030.1 hypothetical protein IIM_04892 [Bacillus cereus VD107]MCW9133919.1 hypothetical protein [Bacillus paramycoides]
MSCGRRCECDECFERRLRNVRRNVRRRFECERENVFGRRRRLDGIREGDKIQVFSGGDRINGTGVFINVEDGFLVWVDNNANINITSLDVINVRRIS